MQAADDLPPCAQVEDDAGPAEASQLRPLIVSPGTSFSRQHNPNMDIHVAMIKHKQSLEKDREQSREGSFTMLVTDCVAVRYQS